MAREGIQLQVVPYQRVYRPSKLRRRSVGARHKYTRTLAGKWIVAARRPAPAAAWPH
ncbi:MAG: hypothetical protein SGI92_19315 [Bryobacteraceae bacterium]|nr:hypothetical protein [Bryobacteraceae bacterium]